MVKSTRGPDHIADHVESRGCRHHYVLYSKGADYYDLPYWTYVHMTNPERERIIIELLEKWKEEQEASK